MSEISFKSIYDGVSLALHAAFPAVQVHGGNVKQGLNPGDLNVVMPSAGQSKQVGERFLRTPTLDVIYYPKVGVAECCEVADQLTMLLRDITTPEGDLIHCTNCEWTIEEGVLHVLVSYDHHAYIPQEPVLMDTLDIEMEGETWRKPRPRTAKRPPGPLLTKRSSLWPPSDMPTGGTSSGLCWRTARPTP